MKSLLSLFVILSLAGCWDNSFPPPCSTDWVEVSYHRDRNTCPWAGPELLPEVLPVNGCSPTHIRDSWSFVETTHPFADCIVYDETYIQWDFDHVMGWYLRGFRELGYSCADGYCVVWYRARFE